jgi:hypothetical protein
MAPVYIWNTYKHFCSLFIEQISEIKYSEIEKDFSSIMSSLASYLIENIPSSEQEDNTVIDDYPSYKL